MTLPGRMLVAPEAPSPPRRQSNDDHPPRRASVRAVTTSAALPLLWHGRARKSSPRACSPAPYLHLLPSSILRPLESLRRPACPGHGVYHSDTEQPSVDHGETNPLGVAGERLHRRSPVDQQHPCDFVVSARLPMGRAVWLPSFMAGVAAIRFLISVAIVMNACSTLVALFALVSRKGTPSESANSCAPPVARAGYR